MTQHIIAIDGPAGSGKSTTAGAVAGALGFAHLDSGALYRAVTLAAIDAGVPDVAELVLGAARQAGVRLVSVGNAFRPEMDGVDVSQPIRSAEVTGRVSTIAALSPVRDWVNQRLRAAAAEHPVGVILEGRDIGTVVFPDAPLKIFLTAAPEARARRRLVQEGGRPDAAALDRTSVELADRDERDRSRDVAPLRQPADAIELDTTGLTFEEQVRRIVELAEQRFGRGGS